jgi:Flp pilus assembly protein TadG
MSVHDREKRRQQQSRDREGADTLLITRRAPEDRSLTVAAPRAGRRDRRAGAAATELAMVLPLVLMLAFGCAEIGRALSIYMMVSDAASAGAVYGAMHGYTSYTQSSWENQIIQEVQNAAQGNASFNSSNLSVTVTTTSETGGYNLTTVTASYNFETITALSTLPTQFAIVHTVAIRRFQ